ncbi:MAG: hypothetical protein HQ518_15025 [Rhodopirellula sp.]|nr:hypothetical protein [Rhodopirellula sp.]
MSNEPIPIEDDEILYRRIPVSREWYVNGELHPEAFGPRKDEHSGISVYRKRFKSLEDVAQGKSRKGYFVVSLRVSDLKTCGITVEPRPEVEDGWDDAHAELPGLNAANRKTDEAEELQAILAELGVILPVEGPFVAETGGAQ